MKSTSQDDHLVKPKPLEINYILTKKCAPCNPLITGIRLFFYFLLPALNFPAFSFPFSGTHLGFLPKCTEPHIPKTSGIVFP